LPDAGPEENKERGIYVAITVVGSVAFDSIETPAGRRERCLGGAATYFSLAASYFTDVRVIAVVGEDFGADEIGVFEKRGIDTQGLERTAGKSFFWEGSYLDNLNEAKTHNTELNVFGAFEPKIPDAYRDSEFLFLANIDPVLQRRVREAMPQAKLVAGDTMNYWIKDHRDAPKEVLKGLDILLINDTETRMLAGNNNLAERARRAGHGPRMLVVKHGEYGATAFYGASTNGVGAKTFPARAAAGGSGGPDGSRRQLCRRILRLPCVAEGNDSGSVPARNVLRQRDGFVCGGALWNGTAAGALAQRDR
jgi:hypothetical protein